MPNRPNVLFIVLDTQRRDRLSTYGHAQETSPELDRFSTDATVFERAVSPAQWTVPAHASLFTGHYASTHQLIEANSKLADAYPTLAEILRASDYHTVGFCNNPLVGVLNNGLQRGFDEFYNYAGAAPNRPLQTRKQMLPRPLTRGWEQFARSVSQVFAHSDFLFRISLHPLLTPIWTRYINYKGSTENSLADAVDYFKHHRSTDERPLFMFINLMGTHLPYRPPQDALARVAPHLKRDGAAWRFMRQFNADASRWASPLDAPLADWQEQTINDFYNAEIAAQDALLGRALKKFKQMGALDDTLVIVAADHGEGHGDHGYVGHSFVVYQELVHVPLMIRYPDHFPAGKRVTTNVSTRRLFHTVLDVTGVPAPFAGDHPNANIHGLSLARATNCKPDTEGGVAFSEAFPPQTFLSVLKHRNPHLIHKLNLTDVRRGVYHGEHKLATVGARVEGLFDVQSDPNEVRDVSAQHDAITQNLHTRISSFVQAAESQRVANAQIGDISDDMADHLRALGYME